MNLQSQPILIVEDNAGDIALVQEALRTHGVQRPLVILRDGESAICHIDQVDAQAALRPSLVVLDLSLPKHSGSEVLRRIRGSEVCRDVVIVVFSSSNATRDRAEAKELGADRYYTKPSNLDEYLHIGATIKELLANSGSSASASDTA